jgi:hypothetical protein
MIALVQIKELINKLSDKLENIKFAHEIKCLQFQIKLIKMILSIPNKLDISLFKDVVALSTFLIISRSTLRETLKSYVCIP